MHISSLLDNLPKPQEKSKGEPRNQREELITKFMDRLNKDREAGGFNKMSYPRVAKMFTGLSESYLYNLYNECEGAKTFGSLLKWKLDQLKAKKKS